MKRLRITAGFIAIMAGCWTDLTTGCRTTLYAQQQNESPTKVVSTRQSTFTIPFSVARSSDPSSTPREVHLLVSDKQGAKESWKLANRAKPDAGQFVFRAWGDGEYWFFVRTIDNQGKIVPEPNAAPGLKVFVDTAQPRIQTTSKHTESGEIETRVTATDQNLNEQSIQLNYQLTGGGAWRKIELVPSNSWKPGQPFASTVRWRPDPHGSAITLKAEASDKAGNRGAGQEQIAASLTTNSGTNKVQQPPPVGGKTHPISAQKNFVSGRNSQPSAPPSSKWPIDGRSDNPPGSSGQALTPPTFDHRPSAPQDPALSTVDPLAPKHSTSMAQELRLKSVNSVSFDIDYQLNDTRSLPGSGWAKVDLWGSQDGGMTWTPYGTDIDRQSPLPVTVPRNGLYGFRLVVTRTDGRMDRQPTRGDTPLIWVHVRDAPKQSPPGTVSPYKSPAGTSRSESNPMATILDVRPR